MDHRHSGADSAYHDAEWDNRVHSAASTDVRQLLRNAQRRRRERWLVTSIVLVAVGLVLALLVRIGVFDGVLPGSSTPPAPGASTPDPATADVPVVDLGRPFAKSPAAEWPDGQAGILTPTAQAVSGYSTEQVAAAMRQVRDVLVASRLDRRVLVDHDARPFLNALAPDARRQLEPLFANGREAEVQSLVSLADGGSRLLPVDPKVTGRMWVEAGGPGELVVHTNYVFVYAFDTDTPEKIADVMDILVVVRAEVDFVLRTGERWTTGSQGWWYGDAGGYAYSIACDSYRKGFLAPAFTERTVTEPPRMGRSAYFDPTSPLPASNGCG